MYILLRFTILNCIVVILLYYYIIGGYPRCEYRLRDNLWYSPLSRNCIYCIILYFYSIHHIQFNSIYIYMRICVYIRYVDVTCSHIVCRENRGRYSRRTYFLAGTIFSTADTRKPSVPCDQGIA